LSIFPSFDCEIVPPDRYSTKALFIPKTFYCQCGIPPLEDGMSFAFLNKEKNLYHQWGGKEIDHEG
jgi:hypothetical protein